MKVFHVNSECLLSEPEECGRNECDCSENEKHFQQNNEVLMENRIYPFTGVNMYVAQHIIPSLLLLTVRMRD